MMEPCFCKPGSMSQCVAENYNEQVSCAGFDRSTVAQRCMYRNEDMANHCDSTYAQSVGLRDADMTVDEATPEGGDRDTDLLEVKDEIDDGNISCLECKKWTCAFIRSEQTKKQSVGGLTLPDLVDFKAGCVFFERK